MNRFVNDESHGVLLESRSANQNLGESQLVLLPYRVHGYSLRSRNWGMSNYT